MATMYEKAMKSGRYAGGTFTFKQGAKKDLQTLIDLRGDEDASEAIGVDLTAAPRSSVGTWAVLKYGSGMVQDEITVDFNQRVVVAGSRLRVDAKLDHFAGPIVVDEAVSAVAYRYPVGTPASGFGVQLASMTHDEQVSGLAFIDPIVNLSRIKQIVVTRINFAAGFTVEFQNTNPGVAYGAIIVAAGGVMLPSDVPKYAQFVKITPTAVSSFSLIELVGA
jgi:hypothetical protein